MLYDALIGALSSMLAGCRIGAIESACVSTGLTSCTASVRINCVRRLTRTRTYSCVAPRMYRKTIVAELWRRRAETTSSGVHELTMGMTADAVSESIGAAVKANVRTRDRLCEMTLSFTDSHIRSLARSSTVASRPTRRLRARTRLSTIRTRSLESSSRGRNGGRS